MIFLQIYLVFGAIGFTVLNVLVLHGNYKHRAHASYMPILGGLFAAAFLATVVSKQLVYFIFLPFIFDPLLMSFLARHIHNKNLNWNGDNLADRVGRPGGGHAFTKNSGEFPGISTRKQFAEEVERVVSNPTEVRELSGGRTAYWDDQTKTVVIRNSSAKDGGTVFKPRNGKSYFDGLQ